METQVTTDLQSVKITKVFSDSIEEEVYFPSQFDEDMGETTIHLKQILLLFSLLDSFFRTDRNTFVAADLIVYYEEANPRTWYAPDVFVCFGVEKKERRTFKTWEEGVFPQVVFEIASDGTFENDLGGKRLEYARLGVEEYYLLDPEREYLPSPLMAFHRQNGRLVSVQVEDGRVLSPLLSLEIVDTGKSFRLFNPQTQEFLQAVLTGEE